VHRTHGSEQQGLYQYQENQIGQIADGFLSNQFGVTRYKANQNQQYNGQKRT
jgi:hypothetical protein